MVIEIDRKATTTTFRHSLEQIKTNRAKYKKANLIEFFGILPDIGDGLEFQKIVRDEWR